MFLFYCYYVEMQLTFLLIQDPTLLNLLVLLVFEFLEISIYIIRPSANREISIYSFQICIHFIQLKKMKRVYNIM
jgi:hypothetical protein